MAVGATTAASPRKINPEAQQNAGPTRHRYGESQCDANRAAPPEQRADQDRQNPRRGRRKAGRSAGRQKRRAGPRFPSGRKFGAVHSSNEVAAGRTSCDARSMRCPCGKQADYNACCGAFIQGWDLPSTAEELMRSRYSAYALGEIDYLVETHSPKPDRAGVEDWARRAKFTGLQIVSTKEGGPEDERGFVEFIAVFEEAGRLRQHHEKSRFKKIDGRWYYVGT